MRSRLRRVAGAATTLVLITGAGASSTVFVDYLADRARLRAYAAATRTPDEATPEREKAAQAEPVKTAPAPPVTTASMAPAQIVTEAPLKTASITASRAFVGDAPRQGDASQAASIALAAKAAAAAPRDEISPETAAVGPEAGLPDGEAPKTLASLSGMKADRNIEAAFSASEVAAGDETHTAAIPAPRPVDDAATEAASLPDKVEERPEKPRKTGHTARVLKYVNLRSRPADESKVLTVVPAKARVSVLSCKSWCNVEYKGTRGFIYKGFIDKS